MKKSERNKKLSEMKNIPVDIVASILGINPHSLRLGMQRNEISIGSAIKTSSQYTYHISYEKLKEYVGIEKLEKYELERNL